MALFNWAMPRFQRIRPVIEGRTMATAKIRFRPAAQLKLVPARTVRRIVPRGHRDAVTTTVHAPAVVEGMQRSLSQLLTDDLAAAPETEVQSTTKRG